MLNRREFLATGLGATLPAQAMPGDKMRFATSGHQFRTTLPHPETGIQMTAAYGYHGIEPFQDDMPRYLEQPPEVFKKVLDNAGIALCTVGSGGQYTDAAEFAKTPDSIVARCRYISSFGCSHLKVNLSRRLGNPADDLSDENAKILARNLNEVGKRTKEEVGVKFAFHPHCWTIVERQAELDKIMDLTDPRYVFLTLDTCHASLGGIDPVKCLRDYYDRVAHVHLKDCEPKYSAGNGWKGPAPSQEEHQRTNLYKRMGAGGVDFPAFFALLRQRGYGAWVTLDFDAPRPGEGTVQQDMDRHKKYLLETLHVTNLRS
jgi:inosose dehydratase